MDDNSQPNGLLTRDQILAAADLATTRIEVREWGGAVLVRALSAAEVEAWQDANAGRGTHTVSAELAALAIVNEHGARLFSADDVAALAKKSQVALSRVLKVIQKQNALTQREIDALGKDSAPAPAGALPSA